MINIIASCCIKKDEKILLVQQNKEEYKNLWDFPGGKVESNEDIICAAIREVKEETGYNIRVNNILLMQNYVTEKGLLLIIYFNASLIDNENSKYNTDEIRESKWMSINEIKNIKNEKFRGQENIRSIIKNIENGTFYPIDLLETYNLLL